jgi:hypothetical protein
MKALMRVAASRLPHDKAGCLTINRPLSAIGSDDPSRSDLAFGEDHPRAAHAPEAKAATMSGPRGLALRWSKWEHVSAKF